MSSFNQLKDKLKNPNRQHLNYISLPRFDEKQSSQLRNKLTLTLTSAVDGTVTKTFNNIIQGIWNSREKKDLSNTKIHQFNEHGILELHGNDEMILPRINRHRPLKI